jgi:hypothetical protein
MEFSTSYKPWVPILHYFKLVKEGNGGFLDREHSIIIDVLEEMKAGNDWECSPSLHVLRRMGLEWMESVPHRLRPCQFQNLVCRWKLLAIGFVHVNQKFVLQMKSTLAHPITRLQCHAIFSPIYNPMVWN